MGTSKQSGDSHLIASDQYGDVLFPPLAPFIRGYVVPSQAMRRVVLRRMDWLGNAVTAQLFAAIAAGWLLGRLGYALLLWLVACEVTYWWGTRRLVRRMRPLPLNVSLQIYTQEWDGEKLSGGAFLGALFGTIAVVGGVMLRDPSLIIFGIGSLIWAGRLLLILGYRVARKLGVVPVRGEKRSS